MLFVGCGSKTLLQESTAVKAQEAKSKTLPKKRYYSGRFEYKIAPHDRIQITVYNHPELSTASAEGMNAREGILVNSDGIISLPLLGPVRVAGLTQPQAARKIQTAYSRYLKHANVYLEVLNKRAYVVGEVKRAGPIKLSNEQTTLLQAITEAGGFGDQANREKIIIIRKHGKGSQVDVVDLTDTASLSYAAMMIRPNDIVYVTPSSMKAVALPATPVFKLVADALLPFVRYQDLTD